MKRQLQMFFVAKVKRQLQMFFCSESETSATEVKASSGKIFAKMMV
ncbi:hypothetical protein FJQ98_23890 [Lysinibacillus agricola]|uniref:Uncharacterized protein n=1 Tax=Lysinibacillus agricola TaxID=2590012 RepID=A0ABX7AQ72_9BACI|nr:MULTISPECIES: hypothetical protein [Lysinibacillus]QQP12106.1 hypothetical protein FJQ98_23890 [Lysinibacillus agricola]